MYVYMTTLKKAAALKKNSRMITNVESPLLMNDEKDEEMTKSALEAFRAKEEEIERRKSEVREKVEAQLGRVEEETKRLVGIRGVSFLAN